MRGITPITGLRVEVPLRFGSVSPLAILSVNKVWHSRGGDISRGYGVAEEPTLGGDGSGDVAPTNGSKSSSGAPGQGSGGGRPGKLPAGFPPKLLLLLL